MDSASRKRRTRSHIIEDLSLNHVAYFVFKSGHVVDKPAHDYGCDLYVDFYSAITGELDDGKVYLQVKATDRIRLDKEHQHVLFPVQVRDLKQWMYDPFPWIFVVYDAQKEVAYWRYIQAYFGGKNWKKQKTIQMQIPVKNKLTLQAIERFSVFSKRVVAQIQQAIIVHEER